MSNIRSKSAIFEAACEIARFESTIRERLNIHGSILGIRHIPLMGTCVVFMTGANTFDVKPITEAQLCSIEAELLGHPRCVDCNDFVTDTLHTSKHALAAHACPICGAPLCKDCGTDIGLCHVCSKFNYHIKTAPWVYEEYTKLPVEILQEIHKLESRYDRTRELRERIVHALIEKKHEK